MRIRFRNMSAVALTLVSFAALPALADDTTPADTSAHSSGPVDGCVKGSDSESFWKRLSQSYEKHLFPGDMPTAPAVDPNAPFDEQAAGYRQDLPPPPTGYAYDNPCYAPAVTDVSTCTYSSGGRTYTFDQNGGKRSQAMIAVDAIFHF